MSAGPENGELLDLLFAAQAEVNQCFAAGQVTAGQGEEAHLLAGRSLQPHRGANPPLVAPRSAELHHDPVRFAGVVAVDADRFFQVGADDFEVAVPVEIGRYCSVAHSGVVQTPGHAHVLELEIAKVAEGQVLLLEGTGSSPLVLGPLRFAGEGLEGGLIVGHVQVHRHPVGEIGVDPPVIVEIGETHRPGPIRVGQAGHVSGLPEAACAGIEKNHIAHVLARDCGVEEFRVVGHRPHADLLFEVVGSRHVRHEEINSSVAIEIGGVGSHRKPGDVRNDRLDGVLEGAVGLAHEKRVGVLEVVGDVEFGPTVFVRIPPERGITLAPELAGARDFGEGPVPVISHQAVGLADRIVRHVQVVRPRDLPDLGDPVKFLEGGHDLGFAVDHAHDPTGDLAARIVEKVGHQVEIEVPVEIEVTEGRGVACPLEVHAEPLGPLHEGAVAPVEEEVILGVVVAHVDVEIAVVVDVDDCGPRAPGPFASHLGLGGDVLEDEIAGLAVGHRAAREKEVRPPIVVDVADRHSATAHRGGVEIGHGVVLDDGIDQVHTGLAGGEDGKEGLPARRLGSRERLGLDSSLHEGNVLLSPRSLFSAPGQEQ